MSLRPSCAECGTSSPDTNTNYTLISQTGWRLTRNKATDGKAVVEWRCPECWAKRKASGEPSAVPPSFAPTKRR